MSDLQEFSYDHMCDKCGNREDLVVKYAPAQEGGAVLFGRVTPKVPECLRITCPCGYVWRTKCLVQEDSDG